MVEDQLHFVVDMLRVVDRLAVDHTFEFDLIVVPVLVDSQPVSDLDVGSHWDKHLRLVHQMLLLGEYYHDDNPVVHRHLVDNLVVVVHKACYLDNQIVADTVDLVAGNRDNARAADIHHDILAEHLVVVVVVRLVDAAAVMLVDHRLVVRVHHDIHPVLVAVVVVVAAAVIQLEVVEHHLVHHLIEVHYSAACYVVG